MENKKYTPASDQQIHAIRTYLANQRQQKKKNKPKISMKDTLLGKNREVNAFAKKQGRQTGQKIKEFGQTCKRTFQEEKAKMKDTFKSMNMEWDRIIRSNNKNYIADIELRKQKADSIAYIGLIFQLQMNLLQYEHDLLTCIEHKVFERDDCPEEIYFDDKKQTFQTEGNKIILFLKKLDTNLRNCQEYFYNTLTKNELLTNRQLSEFKILKEYVGSVRRQLMIQVLYKKYNWLANKTKEELRNIKFKQAIDYNIAMYKKGYRNLLEGIASCKDMIYDSFLMSLRKTLNWGRSGIAGFTGDRDRDKSTRENFGRLGSQVLESLTETHNSFQKNLNDNLKKQIVERFKEYNKKLLQAQQTKHQRTPGQTSHIALNIPAIQYKKSKTSQNQNKSSGKMQQDALEKQRKERERRAQQARLQTQALMKKLRQQKDKKMEQQNKKGIKRGRQRQQEQQQQQQQQQQQKTGDEMQQQK